MEPAFDSVEELMVAVESESLNASDLSIKQYDESIIQISITDPDLILREYADSILAINDTEKQYLYIGNTSDIIKDLIRLC